MLEEDSKIKWQQFIGGDHKAYSWLYKTYIQVLYSYGTRFTSDHELIKDCIQEVFTTIWKNRNNLALPDNVKVYLMVSLKNSLIRHLYKNELFQKYDPDETIIFSLESTVEEEFIENEESSHLQQKIKEIISILTPRQQEIIFYRFIQELSFDEICSLMDLNYQSAQNLIQRSLKKVRENYNGSLTIFLLLFIALYKENFS